jgi:hypothetical protein
MVEPESNSLYRPQGPGGPQSIGQVLDSGFRVFRVSLVRCLLFGAMAMIAGQLPNIYSLAIGDAAGVYLSGNAVTLALALLGSVLTVYLSAAMLIRQREIAQGRRQPTRVDLAQGLRRLPVLLGVVAISVVVLAVVPAGLWATTATELISSAIRIPLSVVLVLLGVVTLWLLPGLAMAIVVAVLTTSGVLASLRQGITLVIGNWWRTMLTFAVWGVLLVVFNFVVVVLMLMALPLLGATDIVTLTAGTPVVLVALRAVGLPFLVAILLVVHGELQVRKQGVDLQRRVAGVAQA